MKWKVVLVLLMMTGAIRPATASPILFSAALSGPAESPANISPGTGFSLVTIDAALHTMRVQVTFQDLLAGNTASHIHVINGPGDANMADTLGPVTTTTPTFTGFPTGAIAGAYDNTLDMTLASSYRAGWITDSGGTTALAEAALFSGITSGRAYLNIHSTLYPGGEIRGFLAPVDLNAVPEPTSLLLLGTGGLGLIAILRNRRKRTHAQA
jgi:hypothetical protein